MKHVFLISNHSLDVVEEAIALVEKKLAKEKANLKYEVQYGRATPARGLNIYHSDIVVFLKSASLTANQEFINRSSIIILMDDPMNLHHVVSKAKTNWDFESRQSGYGFRLLTKPVEDLARAIHKVYQTKDSKASVTIQDFDFIPTVLNSISDSISFIHDFSGLMYSMKSDYEREQFRNQFFTWVMSNEETAGLVERVTKHTKVSAKNKRLHSLAKAIDGNARIRGAIRSTIKSVKDKRPFSIEKAAHAAKVSAYDLRYIANLMRKKPLLLEMVNSEKVHKQRHRQRFVDDSGPDEMELEFAQ